MQAYQVSFCLLVSNVSFVLIKLDCDISGVGLKQMQRALAVICRAFVEAGHSFLQIRHANLSKTSRLDYTTLSNSL